jgi:hypothetical protein
LSEAAQGEPPKHGVFFKPFKVEPVYEFWETPDSYRRYPGGSELTPMLKVWHVQQTAGPEKRFIAPYGAVARPWDAKEAPDAEILTIGYNTGKMNGAVAVGRHGNFLQWGFSAPPSKMTDAGQKFFLNCICYAAQFDDKVPKTKK